MDYTDPRIEVACRAYTSNLIPQCQFDNLTAEGKASMRYLMKPVLEALLPNIVKLVTPPEQVVA